MAEPIQLESAEQFYFELPLYADVQAPLDQGAVPDVVRAIYGFGGKLDGYCPHCRRQVTFTVRKVYSVETVNNVARSSFDRGTIVCDRDDLHHLTFHWLYTKGVLQKIGQFPSTATIANAELNQSAR